MLPTAQALLVELAATAMRSSPAANVGLGTCLHTRSGGG